MFPILEERGGVLEKWGGANWKVICSETQLDGVAAAAAPPGVQIIDDQIINRNSS